jgi:hypothetical protein
MVHHQAIGEVDFLVGAQAGCGKLFIVGGAEHRVGVGTVIEAQHVFFVYFAHGADVDPLIVHGVISCFKED